MSDNKAKALVTDVGISCKLLVYAKFALGRGEDESWWPSLVIHPGDLPGLNIKFAGWLLHAMFCITGTAGYLEQAVAEGEDGRWVRVDGDRVVPADGACYRYQASLDRTYISSSPIHSKLTCSWSAV